MASLTHTTLCKKKKKKQHSEGDDQQCHYGYACFLPQEALCPGNSSEHHGID